MVGPRDDDAAGDDDGGGGMRDAIGSRQVRPPRGREILACLVVAVGLLAGCSGPSAASPTATATVVQAAAATPTPGSSGTPAPTPTATTTPPAVATSVATGTATAAATPGGQGQGSGSSQTYLDDRSDAAEVIRSYYNAINLQQFARAYGYWESGVPASQLPPFAQFEQGFTDTGRVDLTLGQISGGAAAGNRYYSVPVVLNAHMTGGGIQTFSGCYTLHLGDPANQTMPPLHPMAIQAATVKLAGAGATTSGLLAGACPADQGQPVPPTPAAAPGDIAAARYLDDRGTAEAVVSSYYNAINRQENARAYGYWESGVPTSQLPPFAQFEQGFTDTGRVDLTLGQISGGAAAGNRYYSVPVVLNAHMAGGGIQTFSGCYTLHLGDPANQTMPPFHPMAIQAATVKLVGAGATTAGLLAGACPADQGQPVPPTPAATPGDIAAARYLDDRGTAEAVVRSYYNAVNRQEYARAYGYWEPAAAASQLKPFDQFQQGYAQTTSVTLTIGTVGSDVGAGQLYYMVPVAIAARNSDGSTQRFVGCYRLHLARPEIQAVPPFQPLAIQSASLRQVPVGASAEAPTAQSCQP
ncbi:MAG TPA: hypothetical protein VMU89_25270 [Thermomicrobiaceae bacterium]|nr:hypothetical protein [Thermomicrobiaceae bacterium]